jgi:hypothetical protein
VVGGHQGDAQCQGEKQQAAVCAGGFATLGSWAHDGRELAKVFEISAGILHPEENKRIVPRAGNGLTETEISAPRNQEKRLLSRRREKRTIRRNCEPARAGSREVWP